MSLAQVQGTNQDLSKAHSNSDSSTRADEKRSQLVYLRCNQTPKYPYAEVCG
jgi:hypothetical protein